MPLKSPIGVLLHFLFLMFRSVFCKFFKNKGTKLEAIKNKKREKKNEKHAIRLLEVVEGENQGEESVSN